MPTSHNATMWPGLYAPAIFVKGLAIVSLATTCLLAPVAAGAQAAPPPVSAQPVPGELEIDKLIWSTMTAVEHANLSGNYSVLRDISAPGFQINNDPARLAAAFASIRASRIDLSNTLLLAPTFVGAPSMVEAGVFRVRGYFGLRPTAITFTLDYQWVQGRWRVYGMSIVPQSLATLEVQAAPPPAPQPSARPTRN